MKLKNKILYSIFFLSLLISIFHSYHSLNLFYQDKRNYINESILERTENLSNLLGNEIELRKSQIELVSSLVIEENEELISFFLDRDFRLYALGSLSSGNDLKIRFTDVFQSDSYINRDDLVEWFDSFQEKFYQIHHDESRSDMSYIDITPLRIADSYQVLVSLGDSVNMFFFLVDINWLYKELVSHGTINSYIFRTGGGDFLQSNDEIGSIALEQIDLVVDRGLAFIDEDKLSGIVSFVKMDMLDLIFISFISNEDGFAIIKKIIFTSLSFSLLGLAFFMTLGLFFSRSLTRPINSLVDASENIAKGDFQSKVNIKTKDEFSVLGDTFNSMTSTLSKLFSEREELINDLKKLNNQLENANKNLERRVSQRTEELSEAKRFIQAMVDSIDQGLFVFDKNGKCENFYTNSCKELFGKTPYKLKYSEFLDLDEGEVSTFDKLLPLFFHETLPFDSAKGLALKNKVYISEDTNLERHISFDYYPMVDDDEITSHVVTVATDRTDEVVAQRAYDRQQAFVEMVLKVIKDKKGFRRFLDNAKDLLDEIYSTLEKRGSECLSVLAFHLHSLNGGFGVYKIHDLQVQVISFENLVSDLKVKTGQNDLLDNELIDQVTKLFYELYSNFLLFIDQNSYLWREPSGLMTIQKSELETIKGLIKVGDYISANNTIIDILEKERVDVLLSEPVDIISQMSEKLNKPMKKIEIEGGGNRIDPVLNKDILSSLVHLFRNCMDHGIEDQETRKALGKDLQGEISIRSHVDDLGNWHLLIKDDGAGINRQALIKKASEINSSLVCDNMTDGDILNLVFLENVSTRDGVGEFSGRGVGMGAIKLSVEKIGGSIDIESFEGRGTSFYFVIPQ